MSAAICPYCRTPVDQNEAILCPGCATPHHADCFEENGGCTIFGCSAAPPAEPKLSIDAAEVLRATQTPSAAPPPRDGAVPPPPLTTTNAAAQPVSAPLFASTGYRQYAVPVPQLQSTAYALAGAYTPEQNLSDKKRSTFVLLGATLGAFGAHSFYTGDNKKGSIQLAITLLSLGFAGLMVWVWAIIDIATLTTDNDGRTLRN
jgi:TM2 domain-containing membrane protein YozV